MALTRRPTVLLCLRSLDTWWATATMKPCSNSAGHSNRDPTSRLVLTGKSLPNNVLSRPNRLYHAPVPYPKILDPETFVVVCALLGQVCLPACSVIAVEVEESVGSDCRYRRRWCFPRSLDLHVLRVCFVVPRVTSLHLKSGWSNRGCVEVGNTEQLLPSCKNASLQPPSSYADHHP